MFRTIIKTYQINILNSIITYKQATLYECIEFSYIINKKDFRLDKWLVDFIKDNGGNLKISDFRKLDLQKLIDTILDTRFKGFFNKNKGKGDTIPYESYLMLLSENFNTDPLYIIKNYTPEMLEFYSNGIIYNNNEKTPEGRKRNIINANMKKMQEEDNKENDLAEIKAMQEKLDKKLKKDLK